jgi:hypothetical protein
MNYAFGLKSNLSFVNLTVNPEHLNRERGQLCFFNIIGANFSTNSQKKRLTNGVKSEIKLSFTEVLLHFCPKIRFLNSYYYGRVRHVPLTSTVIQKFNIFLYMAQSGFFISDYFEPSTPGDFGQFFSTQLKKI